MEYKHRILMQGQNVKMDFTFLSNEDKVNNLCTAISGQFKGELTHTVASQRAGVHATEATFNAGERTEYDAPTTGSVESFEIYFDLYPEKRADYVLVDGEYVLYAELKEARA